MHKSQPPPTSVFCIQDWWIQTSSASTPPHAPYASCHVLSPCSVRHGRWDEASQYILSLHAVSLPDWLCVQFIQRECINSYRFTVSLCTAYTQVTVTLPLPHWGVGCGVVGGGQLSVIHQELEMRPCLSVSFFGTAEAVWECHGCSWGWGLRLELWAVRTGQSSLRAIICMINNLRYASGHRRLSPDCGWPRKRADDGFSHKLCD